MKELAEMLTAVRSKGLKGTTPGEVLIIIVQILKITGVISGITAVIRGITDLAAIISALKEAAAGRTIDSGKLNVRIRTLSRMPLLKNRKSTGTKKSAGIIRNVTGSPGRISSMKRMKLR
jgi:hypothetical protein